MNFYGILTESSPTEYNWTGYVYVAEIEFIPPPDCNEGTLEWIAFSNLLDVPTPTIISMVEEFEDKKVI
jgi:8-oxo-dGTP diphosphatase